jgi:hypothetical protein
MNNYGTFLLGVNVGTGHGIGGTYNLQQKSGICVCMFFSGDDAANPRG